MLASTRLVPTSRPFTATRAAPAVRRAPLTVVCVKPTKIADFSTLADEEVVKKIADLKKELATTRFIQRTRGITELKGGQEQQQPDTEKIPKGHINKHLRRQVAQLWTLLRERQIKQGINNRTFKKLSRAL